MFAGKVTIFNDGEDDPCIDQGVVIEVTEWGQDPNIEIALGAGDQRVYLEFRLSDLKREVKEQSAS
jgi:hypothetical protein